MAFLQCQRSWSLQSTPTFHTTGLAIAVIHVSLSLPINLFLIYALRQTKQLSSISNCLMVIICCSDSCFCIIAQPLIITYHMDVLKGAKNCLVQFLAFLCAYFFTFFSMFKLAALSLDRYLHVTKLNNYNKYMNRMRALVLTIISLVLSALI